MQLCNMYLRNNLPYVPLMSCVLGCRSPPPPRFKARRLRHGCVTTLSENATPVEVVAHIEEIVRVVLLKPPAT